MRQTASMTLWMSCAGAVTDGIRRRNEHRASARVRRFSRLHQLTREKHRDSESCPARDALHHNALDLRLYERRLVRVQRNDRLAIIQLALPERANEYSRLLVRLEPVDRGGREWNQQGQVPDHRDAPNEQRAGDSEADREPDGSAD